VTCRVVALPSQRRPRRGGSSNRCCAGVPRSAQRQKFLRQKSGPRKRRGRRLNERGHGSAASPSGKVLVLLGSATRAPWTVIVFNAACCLTFGARMVLLGARDLMTMPAAIKAATATMSNDDGRMETSHRRVLSHLSMIARTSGKICEPAHKNYLFFRLGRGAQVRCLIRILAVFAGDNERSPRTHGQGANHGTVWKRFSHAKDSRCTGQAFAVSCHFAVFALASLGTG
jgi:hypothetical protein